MMPPSPFPIGRRRFLSLSTAAAALPHLPFSVAAKEEESMAACLAPGKWDLVETTVDTALAGIADIQGPNGELSPAGESHPASTAMAVMAFLSRGHAPGRGTYGAVLEKAIDSVLATQNENGVIGVPSGSSLAYMHGIAGLMLGEVYGLARQGQSRRIRDAIVKALAVTRRAQATPKHPASHKGGVRYFENLTDSDLSVTGWHFMFYRSAKNAEFDVPEAWVTEMLQFVSACREEGRGFGYQPGRGSSFTMSAVGLLCMTMTGRNDHPQAVATARTLLEEDLSRVAGYRVYGLYYASLAMAQMGGPFWKEFYPKLVETQLGDPRNEKGLWQSSDILAPVTGTAFRILSLTPPCQLLPIFQR